MKKTALILFLVPLRGASLVAGQQHRQIPFTASETAPQAGSVSGSALLALTGRALAFQTATPGQGPHTEEDRRFQQIISKQRRGEPVSDEEKAFVRNVQAKRREQYAKEHPPRESTGMIPLPDLGAGTYKAEGGGLYPGGENVPPSAHLKAGG